MLSHIEFDSALDAIAGGDRTARLNLIDAYDNIRRKGDGRIAAEKWLTGQIQRGSLTRRLSEVAELLRDYSAQNAIKNLIRIGDISEMEKVAELLTSKNIKDAIIGQALDEETIRARAKLYEGCKDTTPLQARRRLRKFAKQSVSMINLILKLVGANANLYCTPFELSLRNQQKAQWRAFGEAHTLVRDDKEIKMIDVMRGAGKNRMSENYALAVGIDKYATAAGMTWAMVTGTCPPRMHPNPENGHCTWDGTTPDIAHEWLLHHFDNATKTLVETHQIVMSGYRPTEAQKDGTPHCHWMIFAYPNDMHKIEEVLRDQTADWDSDVGLKFDLNNGKAKSSTYAFKYIYKTVGNIEDLEGAQGGNDAWRSTWSIRGLQFFGIPPLGMWRGLRSQKEVPEDSAIAPLWRAARRGDGAGFIGLMGGLNIKKKDRPFIFKKGGDIEKKTALFIDSGTGEAFSFTAKKWTRTPRPKDTEGTADITQEKNINKKGSLGLIENYPSNPKPNPVTVIEESIFWRPPPEDDDFWLTGDQLKAWQITNPEAAAGFGLPAMPLIDDMIFGAVTPRPKEVPDYLTRSV